MKLLLVLRSALLGPALLAVAANQPAPATVPAVNFSKDVLPLLAKHCVSCHGPLQQKGAYRVDTYEATMKSNASGAVIIPGSAERSLFYMLLTGQQKPRMPMSAPPLSAADLAIFKIWIDAGAKADAPPIAKNMAKATIESKNAPAAKERPVADRHLDIAIPLQTSVPSEFVPLTFYKDVLPVFNANCLGCHSREKKSGGLILESSEALMMSGGAKGPVVVPGKNADSRLLQRIDGTVKPQMPLPLPASDNAKPLAADVVARLKKWIDDGAKPGVEGKAANTLEINAKIGPLPAAAAVAFSNDGKLLAAGVFGKVVLWEVATGKIVKTLTEVAGYVHTLEFSPDGKRLAAGGGLPARSGEVVVFDTTNWSVAQTLKEHLDVVYDVAYNKDGTRLLTASLDKTAKVWDVTRTAGAAASGKVLFNLKDSSDVVNACAFAPDGKFYTASADRSVRVFNGETGKSIRTLTGHTLPVIALAVSPDGKSVVSAGEEPALRWWNLNDGTTLRTAGGHGVACYEIKFSKDGTLVASAGADSTVRLWNGQNGGALRTLTGATDWVYSVALAPDNKLVAGGTADGRVLLWDQATGRLLATFAAHPAKSSTEWLVTTPAGYFDASPEMQKLVTFKVAGELVPSAPFVSALLKPELVAKTLKSETAEAPKVVVTK